MILKVFTDGGALNNPGPAASAYVIYKDDSILIKEAKYLGNATNNYAEYQAVVLAFEKIENLQNEGLLKDSAQVQLFSDSNLLVSQLNGIFKVKNAIIRDFIMRIRVLEVKIGLPISYTHIYREKNTLADSLVKNVLMEHGYRP